MQVQNRGEALDVKLRANLLIALIITIQLANVESRSVYLCKLIECGQEPLTMATPWSVKHYEPITLEELRSLLIDHYVKEVIRIQGLKFVGMGLMGVV